MIAEAFLAAAALTYPDTALTPGAIDPAVTQANIHKTICVPGYTATVRNVTGAEKRQVMTAYLKSHPQWPKCAPIGRVACEYDHRLPLSVGGSNEPKNLWPQPITEARVKDVLEHRVHSELCRKGSHLTLERAQQIFLGDWSACLGSKGAADKCTSK